MPTIFLSPSTQEYNKYVIGGNEEVYMNDIADRMEPYLRASGIGFVRNDPNQNAAAAIKKSNEGTYDVHLALHSNASPEQLAGKLRGIDIYYAPSETESEKLANIVANNLKSIYPNPEDTRALPSIELGELTKTKAPAILAELGYHDNYQDAKWIESNMTQIAKNLVKSLTDYFGIPFVNAGPVRRGVVVTDEGNLNLRNYPSLNGKIIGSIPKGTSVNVYGVVDGWYVTNFEGTPGYASAEFIHIG